jgi:hypothetical protein
MYLQQRAQGLQDTDNRLGLWEDGGVMHMPYQPFSCCCCCCKQDLKTYLQQRAQGLQDIDNRLGLWQDGGVMHMPYQPLHAAAAADACRTLEPIYSSEPRDCRI